MLNSRNGRWKGDFSEVGRAFSNRFLVRWVRLVPNLHTRSNVPQMNPVSMRFRCTTNERLRFNQTFLDVMQEIRFSNRPYILATKETSLHKEPVCRHSLIPLCYAYLITHPRTCGQLPDQTRNFTP